MPRILEHKATTAILLILVAWLILLVLGTQRAGQQAKHELGELEKKIAAVEKDNRDMEELQERYRTPYYLEKQARARLNYKDPDETVVFVYKSNQIEATASKSEESKYVRLWKWFANIF